MSAVYGGVSGALLLAVATLALVTTPPSPPSIAEFAPSAAETIEEAPLDQTSDFGEAGGVEAALRCPPGAVCDAEGKVLVPAGQTTTTLPVVQKARVRRCVGEPPRQTEDPQSPPCVNYFEGNNGGATTPGVTRDEIRIAIPEKGKEFYEPLVLFFNQRFEFYGRKIRLLTYPNSLISNQPQAQRARAARARELGAFAAPTFECGASQNLSQCAPFWKEAAGLGVVTVATDTEMSSEDYRRLHPFAWSLLPAADEVGGLLGDFACKSLVGRTARFAGGLERTKARKFAVLQFQDVGLSRGDVRPLLDHIRRCGGDVKLYEYQNDVANNRLVVNDMQTAGVTTAILFGYHGEAIQGLTTGASSSGYFPEWVVSGAYGTDWEFQWQRNAPADQTEHLFGLRMYNKGLPAQEQPQAAARHEVGATTLEERGGALGRGGVLDNVSYNEMLMLATGIQAAGPNLTPASFGRGLQSLRFANPGAGQARLYQASVGFNGDHSMYDDAGVVWWSQRAPAYGQRASEFGGWCYLQRGARWGARQFPAGEPNLFDATNCGNS